MPRYAIELIGSANMRQVQYIEACDSKQATQTAMDNNSSHKWNYNGMDDSTIEVSSVHVLEDYI